MTPPLPPKKGITTEYPLLLNSFSDNSVKDIDEIQCTEIAYTTRRTTKIQFVSIKYTQI